MKRIRRILLCILMITVLCGISIVGNSVVKSENKSKEKKRTAITKEEMKEWAAPDEESLESYDLGKFSSTLPVVYMNTKGQKKQIVPLRFHPTEQYFPRLHSPSGPAVPLYSYRLPEV